MDNNQYKLHHKIEDLTERMKENEQRVKHLQKKKQRELQIKREKNRLKQEEVEQEIERKRRLEDFKKDQVIEKHNQIAVHLNESKSMFSLFEKITEEQTKKAIMKKEQMAQKLERSFILN
jgi:hypothetical protein